jgi:hypothetical protein
MKKKIIATLICTTMLLSACGSKEEPMPQKAVVNEIHVDDGQVTDNSGTDAFDASIKYLTFNNADALTEISMVNTGWDGPYLYDSETLTKLDSKLTNIVTPLADFISNSTGETVTLTVYNDPADVSPKADIIDNIYKAFDRTVGITDGQLAAISSFADEWIDKTLSVSFNEGAGMIEDSTGTKYSVTEIDATITVNDIPSSFVYGYSVVIGQKTVILRLDNAAWLTFAEIQTGTTNEIVENEVIGDIVNDTPVEEQNIPEESSETPKSYEEYVNGKDAGKYSEYTDGFLVNIDETKTVDLDIGNIDSASLAEGSVKIADVTVGEDGISLNLKGIATGTAVVNVSYTGENATVATAKYFIEVVRASEGGEETEENTEVAETEEIVENPESTTEEITSSDEGTGSITETFKTFDEVVISDEQLITASATETDFETVMKELGIGDIILNTYKTAGDPNKTTLNFFLSMIVNPEKPAVSIGSKVYVKNSPIGSFSFQLPGSYTVVPSGSTSVLCFSDASSNKPKLTSFTLEMRKKDPTNDIMSAWNSSEISKSLKPEAKKVVVENSTSLQLYRTDLTFTTGIDESGASTGEAKTYEVLYMAEYGGYYVYVIVPYDETPSENNGNTSLMIEQILTSLKLSEQASQNVVTENPEENPSTPTQQEETPVEKAFDKEAFNDELSLITSYEKLHGISKDIDLKSYEQIPDLTTLWSQKSITIKNASQYGSTYDLVTSLMEELGNPSTFIYYEYLSDDSTGVKQVYKPNTGEEFTPSYTFAVMSGAVYGIDGYIVTACGYDERFKVTNTDEFGQSYDDPNTATTSEGTQYTFYVTDENLTVIGQVTYTK